MTWPVARVYLVTVILCAAAGYLLRSRRERKRDTAPPLTSYVPLDMSPDHPDHPYQPGAWLSHEHRAEWDDIETRLLQAGLDILDSHEETS